MKSESSENEYSYLFLLTFDCTVVVLSLQSEVEKLHSEIETLSTLQPQQKLTIKQMQEKVQQRDEQIEKQQDM